MKVAILAGGTGLRLSEETRTKPKAMVIIGTRPVLWHLMMYYASSGFRDFVVALGYKGEVIREYFGNGRAEGKIPRNSDSTTAAHTDRSMAEWSVELVDTGLSTETGGRIKRLQPYIGNETFMLTWTDGLADICLENLVAFHRSHGKLATVTAVHPPERFGVLALDGERVKGFTEKPVVHNRWVNGAFFVLEPGVFDYIEGDATQWERGPLQSLAAEGQLMAYRHRSFWQCMDTIHDLAVLQAAWETGTAPWKTWE